MIHNPLASSDPTEQPQPFAAPTIALPKGGGAIRGMGEKFAANPVTGTGSMTVPIATAPGRSGFGPQLALSYDSGAGNGPFGFGWHLSSPAVTRKTDKGLPQYRDGQESDVFILSGAEDLVPVLQPDGTRFKDDATVPEYVIHRYRPRIEGLFARIERWTRVDGDVHWRSISKDNILTIYGQDENSRIADPNDPQRIFSWLICETRDNKGNAVIYRYEVENDANVDRSLANERHRERTTNRYLKRIFYGNRTPLLDDTGHRPRFLTAAQLQLDKDHYKDHWMFEVVFDYGEHDSDAPMPEEPGKAWLIRNDPFSSYRAGFEVRTYRLCRRVLMFHHFPDEPGVGQDCLVCSTTFDYQETPVAAFITAITQSGYKHTDAGGYLRQSLPPLEFEYNQPVIGTDILTVDAVSIENLPVGVDGTTYQWVDLDGEGLSGVLTEQGGSWFYKRNQSALDVDRKTPGETARFSPLETVARVPSGNFMARGAQFLDLAGDGQVDVVEFDRPMAGFYERTDDQDWELFRPFASVPNLDWRDPNLKFVDLTGDSHADVLITENEVITWYPSLAEAGFGPAVRVNVPTDEERGPRVVFADGTQTIFLADLSGDGLTDIARIRNGEVCYWPNLGYGRFGAKVTMDGAPWFDAPDQFDPRHIRLADIDGSGTTDLIYLGRNQTRCWFNQCGNRWSIANELAGFPSVDNVTAVVAVDVLGNGTACLVWSSPLPADRHAPMKYLKLMAEGKPHLLVRAWNNLGAETQVRYAPSTYFYLRDQAEGRPWITKLPFPVHVVERVETFDHISRNRFVTRYAYHHGYFDGEEREFRGFGMVEQWDTEEFAALAGGNVPADNIALESHVPPVRTRTWFHTGVYLKGQQISRQMAKEYFGAPSDEVAFVEYLDRMLLPDTVLPPGLTTEEEREACRALKGSMLRQEVYADDAGHPDATPEQIQRARIPYTVTEQNFTIERVQERGDNRHAAFFTHARESLSYHYERIADDPRIQHALTLEVDHYGNVLKQAAIGYGRRVSPLAEQWDCDRQTTALMTYTENAVTNAVDDTTKYPDDYRSPHPCESRSYELTGVAKRDKRLGFQQVLDDTAAATPLNYEMEPTAGQKQKRLIEHVRTLYRKDDLSGLLSLHKIEPLALSGESYKLAFTPGLLDQVFKRPRQAQPDESLLPAAARATILGSKAGNQGGYVDLDGDGHWWIPSGRSFCHPDDVAAPVELAEARGHFFLPRRHRDPFGQSAVVDFDPHDLLMVETRDALGNRVTVDTNDYRVLQPCLVSDPNRNQTEVAFDALGLVVGTAVMGKPGEVPRPGDTLTGFDADLTQAQLDTFMTAPSQAAADPGRSEATSIAHDLLQGATTRIVYDLDCYRRLGEPPFAATIARETHVSDLAPGKKSHLQISFSYSDGFGREIQKKIQAEPGPFDVNDPASPIANPRWVGSGWTIFNNKGKPIRQCEPFFSKRQRPDGSFYSDHRFEFGVQVGVSPVLFYDPADRVVATLHPNHTWEKVVFDPWQQTTYDVNDTVLLPVRADNPLRDADIAGYFSRLPDADYLPTWHELRTLSAHAAAFADRYPVAEDRQNETKAAERAAGHADTPTTVHFDALGRPFLTVARNRVVCENHPLNGNPDEDFRTRVELDIEGNQRRVLDERKLPDAVHLPLGAQEQRVVMRYDYDLLGHRIHQFSMEAGARWMLNDVAGKPIRAWDSRGHGFTTVYDALRRPIEQYVRGTFSDPDPLKPNSDPRTLNPPNEVGLLVDRIEYGEPPPGATAAQEMETQRLNLRTRIYRHFDSAGIATNTGINPDTAKPEAYDFKGNLLRSTRQLVSDYRAIPDWSRNPQPALDAETFAGGTRYDALNRPIQSVAPRSSLGRGKFNVIQPVFNEANLLDRLDVWLERAAEPDGLLDPSNEAPSPVGVANIDYDAKGQRLLIDYKNGASTFYRYDPLTFRLTQLLTQRKPADFPGDDPQPPIAGWPGKQVQNLRYTYDPAGNITHIQDDAQQAVYFKNQRVEPSNDYVYDALCRLIQANGREHLGQGGTPIPHSHDDAGRVGLPQPGDGNAMGTYTERYVYDAVGNFLQMQHRRSDPAHPGWTRAYDYLETSLIEDGSGGAPLKTSNRLSRTTLNPAGNTPQPETYLHDAHGNMLRMPHLGGGLPGPNMHWDYKDQLRQTDLGGGGTAFYVYDASGQRVRKVWEKVPGLTEERIYLGGFEIFRKHGGSIGANTATLERETLHVMDDKQRIALVEMRTLGNEVDVPQRLIRYQFGNHLGSSSLELNEQAQIISYEEYAPYGSSTYQAVRSRTETAKRYRYTGKERDEESGLYYHGARYLVAWLGKWVNCDPIGTDAGQNLYRYVDNSPTKCVDRTGRWPEVLDKFKEKARRAANRIADDLLGAAGGAVLAVLDNATIGAATHINDRIQGKEGATARGIGSRPAAAEAYIIVSLAQPLAEVGIGGTLIIGGGGGGVAVTAGTGGLASPISVPVAVGATGIGAVFVGHGTIAFATAIPRVNAVRSHMSVGGKEQPAKKQPGKWEKDMAYGTNMSSEQAKYQKQISGRSAAETYYVNGRSFDGFEPGEGGTQDTLVEAKHLAEDGRFINAYENMKKGNFSDFENLVDRAEKLGQQARDQVKAAVGTGARIEWRVSSQRAKEALDMLFKHDPVTKGKIDVKYVPLQPQAGVPRTAD